MAHSSARVLGLPGVAHCSACVLGLPGVAHGSARVLGRFGVAHSSTRVFRASRSGSLFCSSLEDMAHQILDNKAKNIVVMCGAGLSTASGIPDFRYVQPQHHQRHPGLQVRTASAPQAASRTSGTCTYILSTASGIPDFRYVQPQHRQRHPGLQVPTRAAGLRSTLPHSFSSCLA